MTAPIDIEGIEDAIAYWLIPSTGATVHHIEPQDVGAPEPDPPAVQIQWLSYTKISRPDRRKVPSIVSQAIDVTTGGPGSISVVLYRGFADEQTDQTITAALDPGDDADAATAKLLAQLGLDLPPGITAAADGSISTRINVTGSTSAPEFALAPGDDLAKLAVVPLVERYPELEAHWARLVWRCNFKCAATRGFGSANDLMTRATASLSRLLRPALRRVGWDYKGVPLSTSGFPGDRGETTAILDVAAEGWATIAFQAPAMRRCGLQLIAS